MPLDEVSDMLRIGLALAFALVPSIASAEDELPPEAPATVDEVEVVPTAPRAAGPSMVPAVVVAAPPARPGDLVKRIGVTGRVVSLGLTDGTTETQYGGGGIAASYRINRRWEIVLALDALDAPEGPDLHSTTLAARFHLTPHKKWDWYAVAGIGGLHEVPLEGEAEANEGVTRGRFNLGVGLQRRWPRWSLGAEFQMVGVGPKEEVTEPMSTTARETTPPTAMAVDEGLSGGELTIAATLFF